jgi:glycosyltransferase involved in cell wall biosynthesis
MPEKQKPKVHKSNPPANALKVSIILLDWSCRERFHALDWLNKQNVPRDQYELIWVELYDRVVPEAMKNADVVITCGQKDLYHKHAGYNIGLLHAKGKVITICDSDAIFPEDFIASIIKFFNMTQSGTPDSKVLMHYQWRSSALYPDGISRIDELQRYPWSDLWPNVGASMSVNRSDAIRFGGFDEHKSFSGYLCGPYDLGWRLINAGIPEIWHDESVALWHFSHPDPPASQGQPFSLKLWREKSYPHIDHHAAMAVEAFSTGRLLPLKENQEIHKLRMRQRQIGTKFEEKYSCMTNQNGFSMLQMLKLRILFISEAPVKILKSMIKKALGPQRYKKLIGILFRNQHIYKT